MYVAMMAKYVTGWYYLTLMLTVRPSFNMTECVLQEGVW